MKSKLVYWLVYAGMWILAGLPFKLLYLISDFNFFWLYHVLKYRRKVVRKNLEASFPEKTKAERLVIEKKFYHYLTDYMLEDIKLMRMSPDDLYQRMTYQNTELFLNMLETYGGIILMIPHYANYEWIVGMGGIMKKGDIPVQIYKPLRDPYLDQFFQYIRSRFGGLNVPKHSTARELIKLRRQGKKMVVGLITDQWPSSKEKHWTTFLNQETGFLTGGDKIAKMMKYPVFYCELRKDKRGYCDVSFDLLTEHPEELPENGITEMFARRLEQTILNEPAYWLWSHKRWKKSRLDCESEK